MAYVKPEDLIVFNLSEGSFQALVTGLEFRRFKKSWKDKKTGEQKYRWKSVPYAICKVITTSNGGVSIGDDFLIAGYKLRNHAMSGKKCLVLQNQYLAEWNKGGQEWVRDMIAANKARKAKKAANAAK